jgi:outer membrane protein assembly factor BamB
MPSKPRRIEVGRGEIVQGPVVTSDAVYAGTKEDVTIRFDRQTLRKVWGVSSQGLRLGRAITDDLLTVGGKVGGVRATDDGRLLWTAPTRFMGVGAWEGRAIVDSDEGLELRDPRTGGVVVTHVIAGGYWGRLLTNGDLAILESEHCTKALNLATGHLEWVRPLEDEMQRRLPARTDSGAIRLAVGSRPHNLIAFYSGATFAVSAADGSILWHAPVWGPDTWPSVHRGRIYALFWDRFFALDEETGAVVYDVHHPTLKNAFRQKTGTVFRDRIAVALEIGWLAIFNLTNGSLVTLFDAKAPLWRTAEADGRLLVATGDGALLVFDESIWGL